MPNTETRLEKEKAMDGSKNKQAEEAITRLMRKLVIVKDQVVTGFPSRNNRSNAGAGSWPRLPGAYAVGDPHAPVAVCTLASNDLFASLARLPGVAIAGRVYSANLGIERMIANVIANPAIRFLLVCGKESPYFQAGQALCTLFSNGVTPQGRIIEATGHMPELSHISMAHVEHFRNQVQLVDCTGETHTQRLTATIQNLSSRNPGPYQNRTLQKDESSPKHKKVDEFKPIRLGGHRESLAYDPKGFFIINLEREIGEILVHHYLPDHSPAHVVQGRSSEAILLALLREELISQKSHAAYLGAELAKAETALRLDLHYDQDRPLRPHKEVPT
jgi:tetrahydromethanopterin S-methyltransferase subunit A